ncbi:MAG: class I SAM-dependent DNA methyltransferase, partial [Pseudorhodobacter sp.]
MSRLTTNDLRARAAAFVANHKHDSDEMKHTQTFWNDFFFDIFGLKRERVAVYEKSVEKLKGPNKGRIDLFWPGEIIIEQKSLGKDLFGAEQQALAYTHGLSDAELPKRILVCDFQQWKLTDLTTGDTHAFALQDLPKNIDRFNWVLGRQTAKFKDQDPVNIKAAELVGHLHDLLKASGYTGHRLEVFLTRIVFCLFADDTGIFEPKDILWDYLEHRTSPDGADLGPKLAQLFDVLNTPEPQRQTTLDPDLARFPYVNGHLFAEYFPPPAFDTHMRTALLNACRFDWTPISPAIFGSLFQSVMDADERRKKGAHYTTEKNIQKLIGPLFMDDLRAEFARAKARKTGREPALRAFHDKLAGLTFFDPACGCGNFLIIAYRELRALELELLQELNTSGQLSLDAATLSRIDVDQFYGIEIAEFPARIAETALWMMDHLMNLALSAAFGGYYPRIPLKKAPKIVHGDALEVDWATVLPPERCSYVLGNPPFIGHHLQTVEQKAQLRRTYGTFGDSAGVMDFVSAWFIKAAQYIDKTAIECAFVSTNSITQG